tara:strand:- start:213 stop:611 length:399 start_codon:yes stop_codon:yes gene_type:complete
MTYKPVKPSLGYIQATGLNSSTVSSLAFDIPNDMQTTESSGRTELDANSLVKMALSRSNDAQNRSSAFSTSSAQTDIRFRGRIPAEVTNYFQSSEYAFDYRDFIEPYQTSTAGVGDIAFTSYSHVLIWRLAL